MDFCEIKVKTAKNGTMEIYPDFKVINSKDLLVKGKYFYAVWDEENGQWSTDILDVQRIVDAEIYKKREEIGQVESPVYLKTLGDFSTLKWTEFINYMTKMPTSKRVLNQTLIFANTKTTKESYSSKRLNYSLEEGDISAYDELMSTLYSPEEREKIEWAIGSIINGDSKIIQKFIVLYGPAGAGKSTVLKIIEQLFDGYTTMFDAESLGQRSNSFSTEVFAGSPLVAIQHDGDLSRIETNSKLNSIISHEDMVVNEKFKAQYTAKNSSFLFIASNKPVKITDAKSGIIRRLIDVRPTGNKISSNRYYSLMDKIPFELGAIAYHCLKVYEERGKNYYDDYKPLDMMFQTDYFFNFVEDSFDIFNSEDFVTLKQAYELYVQFCSESAIEKRLPKFKFRDELKNYFDDYKDQYLYNGLHYRCCYFGFLTDKFERAKVEVDEKIENKPSLIFDKTVSLFDEEFADCPAQYAINRENSVDVPKYKWDNVTTKLSDISSSKVHYVKVPNDIIVIDFDLKNAEGKKDKKLNLEAASKWPPTYGEFSKGGSGVHLVYRYSGDTNKLAMEFSPGIEIKTFNGNASLRRKLSYCNDLPIATINSGLPLKEEKKEMITDKAIKTELGLRRLIFRCLRKEFGSTTQNINFIKDILDECYNGDMEYDVSDLYYEVYNFAMNSTNQSSACCKKVDEMKFKSKSMEIDKQEVISGGTRVKVIFDLEVYKNLSVIVYKELDKEPRALINPKPIDIQMLLKYDLIGFNCRRYDNHIIYGMLLGYTNEELYELSQKIINAPKGSKNSGMFGEAYNISYTDIYDYCSAANKMSLKKWEIKLGIHHLEWNHPWDEPVPKELIPKVVEYCTNDVLATQAVWEATQGDFLAREILADLAGLTVNHTTNSLTTKIIFGDDRHPQDQFFYRNLAVDGGKDGYFSYKDYLSGKDCSGKKPYFPGYTYNYGKSVYRDEEVGEGGRVYAEPGMYSNALVLDIASMHPHSVMAEMLFGKYTENFAALVNARVAIKHKNFDVVRRMFDGKLVKWLNDEKYAEPLALALKTAINAVYGLTTASFDNPFRDKRNIDNIVAKRGALFMTDLKFAVQAKGYPVIHIKTDSIKIPISSLNDEIIDFIIKMGKAYGYDFEVENMYKKICLVNDAVYIAQKDNGKWDATGKQFAEPYVFKTLFSKEPLIFDDYIQFKQVQTSLYLNFNESGEDNMEFIGRTGAFVPIMPGHGGGELLRKDGEKYVSAVGAKGYRWMEAEKIRGTEMEKFIDISYYESLAKKAKAVISEFGDFDMFVND